MNGTIGRRGVLAGASMLFLGACSKVADSTVGSHLLGAAETWHKKVHRSLADRMALAREYEKDDISPTFKGNGTVNINTPEYQAATQNRFADWRLEVRGMVDTPMSLSMDNIRALPQRTQITRHDCVEGWSAIGEWTGPQLSTLLEAAGVQEGANFVVFRCADRFSQGPYYESVDMIDAMHPQTIVAHMLNGEALPVKNGAPLRMRVERQLGYKHPKYLTAIELVASLDDIGEGQGGYWEDHHGYQWYAGI
ncbi:molybdopterin-binding protein [Pontixanthobacter aestiaquae]|uniref:Molybdopterin-dependent oxidoreductase n=1 Tax=Pontixanthobacter aestiaquae TaxID=1509367 RepID=A0A844ZDQ3_9SPHN|nr:molybdopterin-binding protein [Pontixanthobacter aestiaquae]MDN3645091.1 molybdopterin-binding protein [Pontixanthobacter aestiaquae]MXO83909.1 molybdopterin-dependent oxidoreductase [Pontixanthobacter aestiaquae]